MKEMTEKLIQIYKNITILYYHNYILQKTLINLN
jgi:hypothetical protein